VGVSQRYRSLFQLEAAYLDCDSRAGEIKLASCAAILPLKNMEAAPYIRCLLALGAVWNVDLNDCPGADAILSHAVR